MKRPSLYLASANVYIVSYIYYNWVSNKFMEVKMRTKHKRILSIFLALALIIGFFPLSRVAAANKDEAGNQAEYDHKRLVIHFDNPDKEEGWNIWGWSQEPNDSGSQYDFKYKDSYGDFLEIEFPPETKKAGFILKLGEGWDHKDIDADRFVDLEKEETHIWLKKGDEKVYLDNPSPEDLTGKTKVIVHFNNPGDEEWAIWLWGDGLEGAEYPFTNKDSFGDVSEITVRGEYKELGFIVKTPGGWTDTTKKNIDSDRTIKISSNPTHVWLRDGDPEVYYKRPLKIEDEDVKLSSLLINGFRELELNLSRIADVSYLLENYTLMVDGESANDLVESILPANDKKEASNKVIIKLKEDIKLDSKIVLQASFSKDSEKKEIEARIGKLIGSKEFDEMFKYDGQLGPIYSKEGTEFKLWAPTSKAVDLLIFNGDELKETIAMTRGDKGVYSAKLPGDQLGTVYMYDVHFADKTNRAVDPYAKAVTINGEKSVVVNPKPSEVKNPVNKDILNPIIYELHVRDLSSQEISGIKDKGTFNGLVEKNTKTPTGQITGFDYIKSLGITHVQLLPIYDYKTVDEKNPKSGFNWGYDPLNYNAVEGSYSTDPYDPQKRIKELQNAVDKFHEEGLGVVMDVVYNHVFDPNGHAFEKIVPGYYFRQGPNGNFLGGTGVGNETASERSMVQKYIIDSISYWAKTFKLDGFRFDLMGTHDIDTINKIYSELKKINPNIIIHGEGWNMDMGIPESQRATQINANKLLNIGFFNDDLRDGIRGSVFDHEDKGFATGKPENEAAILQSIKGGKGLKSYLDAGQLVQYVEAHDNLTLWDKIKATNPDEDDQQSLKRHKLATTMVMFSQGRPFIHAGQEFARTKGGDDNSYKSPDSVNQFDWNRVEKMSDNIDYFRELVKIRKAFSVFNLKDYTKIDNVYTTIKQNDGVIAYSVDQSKEKSLVIAYNGNLEEKEIKLPNGKYTVLVRDQKANSQGLEDIIVENESIKVAPLSSLVLLSNEANKADKTDLIRLVKEVRAIEDIHIYTNETGEALRRDLGNAQQIIDDILASQEDVDKAYDNLLASFNNLKLKEQPEPPVEEETFEDAKGYTGYKMNLRSKPATGDVIDTIDAFELLEGKVGSKAKNWIKVNYKGKEGYVYLPMLGDEVKEGYAKTDINLREGANGEIKGLANKGLYVKGIIYKENPNWLVTLYGNKGLSNLYAPLLQEEPVREEGYAPYSLNMRESANGEILGQVAKYERIIGTIDPVSTGWLKVRHLGRDVYVYRANLVDKIGKLNGKTNLRSLPSTEGKIVTTLDKDSEVWGVFNENSSWLQVNYKGEKAFVWGEFVK